MNPLQFPGGLVTPTAHWPEAHPGDRTPTTLAYEVFQMPRQPLCHMLDLAKFPPPELHR